ncbi:hypothetical protein C2845_PM01G43710 [Panicum miliaceum]|uniref:Uncharacterized protein n=1 Tax=Panicum miliaceum TaxID=4540 RepID=A0A3L6TR70_PANMI|nr:hypothetical protein C2845_PM01G43710 [Panicum miliaceum]
MNQSWGGGTREREKNPKPVAASPQDSRLLSEIQEQQNLLKTYEVMESEESDEEENYCSIELTPSLFTSAVDNAYQLMHDFSKPLLNMMKTAGWDLDAAANAIETAVVYTRTHKKLAYFFDPKVKVFQVKKGSEFSDIHMDSVVKSIILDEGSHSITELFEILFASSFRSSNSHRQL